MSEKQRLSYSKRKQIIKNHITSRIIGAKERGGSIAWMCGVDERTIRRDISKMKVTGEWHEWLELFLLQLYASDEIDDDAKLRSVTTLYAKTMVQKSEVATKGDLTFILKSWRPEKEVEDANS